MRKGELWWFDPTVYHEAHNVSDEPRIHFVIDVLSPNSLKTYLVRAKRAPIRTSYRSIKSLFKRYRPSIVATTAAAAQN
jgi:aspartyl/asparaginyl beta-hydroxylase (cupin superfamily)